jgi:hypothetical protein
LKSSALPGVTLQSGELDRAVTRHDRLRPASSTKRNGHDKLSLSVYALFLGRFFAERTGDDAEDFFFFDNEEVFSVDLDLGAGILAEENAVVFSQCERE